jgi:hypothetical protein
MSTREQYDYGTRDQHDDSVMGAAMWGCLTSLWVLLAGLGVAALLRWAL